MRRGVAVTLILVLWFVLTQDARGQAFPQTQPGGADRVKAEASKMLGGRPVELVLRDRAQTALRGWLDRLNEDSLVFRYFEGSQLAARTIAFADIESIKSKSLKQPSDRSGPGLVVFGAVALVGCLLLIAVI